MYLFAYSDVHSTCLAQLIILNLNIFLVVDEESK
jgi:hypothetical protein